jgi:hypothetical protein
MDGEYLGEPIAWPHPRGWHKLAEGYDHRIDCMYRHYRRLWLFADNTGFAIQYFRPLISMIAWQDYRGERETMWACLEEPVLGR